MTEEIIDFSGYKSFIPCFCRCGCWLLTKLHRGKYNKFIKWHHSRLKTGYKNPMFGKRGKNHPCYRGGRTLSGGYWYIWIPDHPFAPKSGYVLEHRLVMEEYLDRYLRKEEVIHHLDLNTENNRIGNLMLFANQAEHKRYEWAGVSINKKIDMSDRCCLLCGGTKTQIRNENGRPKWYKHNNGVICKKCYERGFVC